jgi:hypothetical protein
LKKLADETMGLIGDIIGIMISLITISILALNALLTQLSVFVVRLPETAAVHILGTAGCFCWLCGLILV